MSPERLEHIYALSKLVQQMFIYGNGYMTAVVCVCVPSRLLVQSVLQIAEKEGANEKQMKTDEKAMKMDVCVSSEKGQTNKTSCDHPINKDACHTHEKDTNAESEAEERKRVCSEVKYQHIAQRLLLEEFRSLGHAHSVAMWEIPQFVLLEHGKGSARK